MKKHHILLGLIIACIAAYFLNETRNLKSMESNVRRELVMLRDAVKRLPGVAAASTPAGDSSNSRPPAIDPAKFTAELNDILKGGPGNESRKTLEDFTTKYQAQIASAPSSKLKEICELLEKDFPFDRKDSERARQAWLFIVGLAEKSDPAWAIAKLDKAASAAKVPIDTMLGTFKSWATQNGEAMNPVYAGALRQWLDTAQAGGRIEESNPLVAELRLEIAAAQGNPSAAVAQMTQLPYASQRKAAMDYVAGLQTPEARRQAMEELSTALHIQNFPYFVRELADQQGFEAAREILGSASLTAEKHDSAAGAIASANIGPDTPRKADWLVKSLRSENGSAVVAFMDSWTQADYNGAAQWMNSLPAGGCRDAAVAGFAPVAARIDGASAVDWALTVTDPARRNACLADAYRAWKDLDPEAANAYLKEKEVTLK